MDVECVTWPADEERLRGLRKRGCPRLVLVAPEAEPPTMFDCLEDWVRLPSSESDIEFRRRGVEARALRHGSIPHVNGDGLIRFRDSWVSLSPVEHRLAGELAQRFGAVVGRDALTRRAWPGTTPKRNAFDVHMLRLRRRLEPLGLAIRTVRGRGYVLEAA
ncbi:MAG: winged helix-turn-helix domain-containing protein [Acidimicrobiia bacterium]